MATMETTSVVMWNKFRNIHIYSFFLYTNFFLPYFAIVLLAVRSELFSMPFIVQFELVT